MIFFLTATIARTVKDKETKKTWKKTHSLLYRTVPDCCITCVVFLVSADLSLCLHMLWLKKLTMVPEMSFVSIYKSHVYLVCFYYEISLTNR